MSREELDRAELGDRVAEALAAENATVPAQQDPFPLACHSCHRAPAARLIVADLTPKLRVERLACGPCAASAVDYVNRMREARLGAGRIYVFSLNLLETDAAMAAGEDARP